MSCKEGTLLQSCVREAGRVRGCRERLQAEGVAYALPVSPRQARWLSPLSPACLPVLPACAACLCCLPSLPAGPGSRLPEQPPVLHHPVPQGCGDRPGAHRGLRGGAIFGGPQVHGWVAGWALWVGGRAGCWVGGWVLWVGGWVDGRVGGWVPSCVAPARCAGSRLQCAARGPTHGPAAASPPAPPLPRLLLQASGTRRRAAT